MKEHPRLKIDVEAADTRKGIKQNEMADEKGDTVHGIFEATLILY